MKRKVSILFLEATLNVGGVENLLFDIAAGIDRRKFAVTVCTLYEPGPVGRRFMAAGHPLYYGLLRHRYQLSALPRLVNIVRTHAVDVIYLVSQPLTVFWGFVIGKLLNIPIVCLAESTIDTGENVKFNLFRFTLPFIDRVVAQAHTQKEHLVRHLGIPNRKISVIYNGIEPARFDPALDRQATLRSVGICPEDKIIGAVGRLQPVKGFDLLIRAAEPILKQYQRMRLVIVGEGPQKKPLRRLADALGIGERVHLLGYRDDKVEWMHLFDVAVLPSRSEALPLVLLEYMACAKAVVAAAVGCIPEIITDRRNGLLAPPEDPRSLADHILFLINQDEERKRIGQNARRTLLQHYRLEKTVAATEQLLAAVSARRRGAAIDRPAAPRRRRTT